MKVLSLFDGMSCGMIAMLNAGVIPERYVAYEIDKFAVQTSMHNFPDIEQCGDVFAADFTQYKGFDWLVGGSPCTYWSIAQTKNRETEASGLGWELFCQYVRALKEAEPRFFIYENNKSMSKAIRASICDTFGFEPICINSALVSAQNRNRLYWVGVRQEDGSYKRANLEQPEDKGILLRDILEGSVLTGTGLEPTTNKALKSLMRPFGSKGKIHQGSDKVQTLMAAAGPKGAGCTPHYAEPVCVASRGRNPENPNDRTAGAPTEQRLEAKTDGKTNTLTTVQKDNYIAEPLPYENTGEALTIKKNLPDIVKKLGYVPAIFNAYNRVEIKDKSHTLTAGGSYVTGSCACNILEPVRPMNYPLESVEFRDAGVVAHLDMPGSHDILKRVYGENGKSPTITAQGGGNVEPKVFSNVELVKLTKEPPFVYEVKDGRIYIHGNSYPIKLPDGFYIIRKLTVTECKRLQTVPEWYEFPVSNSQAYKMLGNGWTCDVITHLIKCALASAPVEPELDAWLL